MERTDRLAQCAVGYNDIAPDAIEDFAPMHGLVTTLDEKDQEVEIAGDERQLTSVTDEQAPAGRENETFEPIAGHNRGGKILCLLCRLCTRRFRTGTQEQK